MTKKHSERPKSGSFYHETRCRRSRFWKNRGFYHEIRVKTGQKPVKNRVKKWGSVKNRGVILPRNTRENESKIGVQNRGFGCQNPGFGCQNRGFGCQNPGFGSKPGVWVWKWVYYKFTSQNREVGCRFWGVGQVDAKFWV